jgi:glycosyltransferase involved in cell wall biosynthesis
MKNWASYVFNSRKISRHESMHDGIDREQSSPPRNGRWHKKMSQPAASSYRIAFITPEYPGCGPHFGIGKYVSDLADFFASSGHQVLVLVPGDSGCFSVTSGQAPRLDLPPENPFILRPWLAGKWLRKLLREFQPDVVEVSNWGALGNHIGNSWPTVVRLSTSAADAGGIRPDRLQWLRVKSEANQVRRAQVVIADSLAMADRAKALYGRSVETIIPHGWNGQIPKTPSWKNRPRQVLFVGRLEPRKGIDVLLSAWPFVLAQCPDAWLHIVGKGTTTSAFERITIHGWLSELELNSLRQSCKAQAIPSRFESFGLVALEAWAHGLVPIASNAGALEEVIDDAGHIFPVDEPQALARALITTLNLDQEHLINKGKHLLTTRFGIGQWTKTTLLAYDQAIKNKSAGVLT